MILLINFYFLVSCFNRCGWRHQVLLTMLAYTSGKCHRASVGQKQAKQCNVDAALMQHRNILLSVNLEPVYLVTPGWQKTARQVAPLNQTALLRGYHPSHNVPA